MVTQLKTVRKVAREVPGEMLHRGASYVIIAEGVFHTFHSLRLVVVAGIVFIIVEFWNMCLDGNVDEKEDAGV